MSTSPDPQRDVRLFTSYLRRPRRLERVVGHFYGRVWIHALRLTGNEDDATDITQDVFLSLLLEPPAAESVRSPMGYLSFRALTLARRMERAAWRRRQRENRAAQELLDQTATNTATHSVDVDAVREAIRDLPEKLRAVIELRYPGQYRNREIAEILGVSERSVEEYLRRGRSPTENPRRDKERRRRTLCFRRCARFPGDLVLGRRS